MTRDKANQIISKNEPLVVACTYNILFTNDIVCGQSIQAIEAIKKTPLYKQKVKKLIKQVEESRRRYEKQLNEIIGDKCDFFANANDTFLEDTEYHLNVFYFSLKRVLDKKHIDNSTCIAKLELSRTLCEFSCVQFDKRMDELRQADPRFHGFCLEHLRLTNMTRLLNEVMSNMRIGQLIDFNTHECIEAMDILAMKLGNAEMIAKAISA